MGRELNTTAPFFPSHSRLISMVPFAVIIVLIGSCNEGAENTDTPSEVTLLKWEVCRLAEGNICLQFDKPPKFVTVNGIAIDVSGAQASFGPNVWIELKLKEDDMLEIEWEDQDGNFGCQTVPVSDFVVPVDAEPPDIVESFPGNGAADVDPERVNAEGVRINFGESVWIEAGDFMLLDSGHELQWTFEWKSQHEIILRPEVGGELQLGKTYIVMLPVLTDAAGNKSAVQSFTFSTKNKIEP